MNHVPRPFSEHTHALVDYLADANLKPCEGISTLERTEILEMFQAMYGITGHTMPSKVIFYDDPGEIDFWEAYAECGETLPAIDARLLLDQVNRRYFEIPAVERAWAYWMRSPARAARAAFIIGESCAVDYDMDRFVMVSEYEQQGYLLTEAEEKALAILGGYAYIRQRRIGWAVHDGDCDTLRLLIAPRVNLDAEQELHCDDRGCAVVFGNGSEIHCQYGRIETDE